ncbi:MAG: hypothetical protein AAB436_04515 [Patescibacteria group bacterium]
MQCLGQEGQNARVTGRSETHFDKSHSDAVDKNDPSAQMELAQFFEEFVLDDPEPQTIRHIGSKAMNNLWEAVLPLIPRKEESHGQE